MKKKQIIGLIFISTVLCSVTFAGFASAIDPYLPEPEDVEGYDLLWESVIIVSNPLNDSAPDIGAGGQVWTKNDTENDVTAVVGVLVIKFSEDVFGKRIPAGIRTMLSLLTSYDNIRTYWDLLVAVVTESAEVTDISDLVTTTDGSIAFDSGTGTYLILSKDAEFLIFTIGFQISNDWISYVQDYSEDVDEVFEAAIVFAASLLAVFQAIIDLIEGFDGGIPTPEPSSILGDTALPPSGDPTSAGDVQYVTIQIGSLYGSFNWLWIILGIVGVVMVGGVILLVVRRKRK